MRKPGSGERVSAQTVERIVDMVRARPGLTNKRLQDACGWTERKTSNALTCAKKAGRIDYTRHQGVRWYVAEAINEAREKHEAQARARNLRADRDRHEAKKLALIESSAVDSPELPGHMIQRRVAADAPLPFALRAPASVFHIGGVL